MHDYSFDTRKKMKQKRLTSLNSLLFCRRYSELCTYVTVPSENTAQLATPNAECLTTMHFLDTTSTPIAARLVIFMPLAILLKNCVLLFVAAIPSVSTSCRILFSGGGFFPLNVIKL